MSPNAQKTAGLQRRKLQHKEEIGQMESATKYNGEN